MTGPRNFREFGPTIRVEGGIKAQSTRGAIGESWWSKRFLTVLESFALGSRLTRGRNYARKGQVLTLTIEPGIVSAAVQGSRPTPYQVTVELDRYGDEVWQAIETALSSQAIFSARLLAGEMPAEILHWRGRDRATLLGRLAALRGSPAPRRRAPRKKPPVPKPGAAAALTEMSSPPLADMVDRFWVAPVPLPARPPTLDTDATLLLRQLPAAPAAIGGTELVEALGELYRDLHQDP